MTHLKTLALATTALIALSGAARAQMLDPAFPQSPDQATAPSYAATVPNGGAPIASVQKITGFGRTFDFGSSSSDTLSSTPVLPGYGIVWSNGNANYVELFSPLVGALDRAGSLSPTATPTPTNFAKAGTTSATAEAQVTQFQSLYGRFASNDIAVMFSGINDFDATLITAANYRSVAATDVANQTTMAGNLINLGAHNLLVLGLPQLGTFQFFNVNLGLGVNDANAVNQGSTLVNQGLLANLATLHQQTGANIHYFDTNLFVNQIRADPLAYGFSVAGVQPGVNCTSLLGVTAASCPANASFAVQNQFLSWDGIHYTYRFHEELAEAIANQLLAPYTVEPQAQLAQADAMAFASSLLLRLDAYRLQTMAQSAEAARQPGVAKPFSLFVEGSFDNSERSSVIGAPGFSESTGGVIAGAEYRVNPFLMVGVAFDHASPGTTITNLGATGRTRIDLDTYQIAGFASLNTHNWFVDAIAGYGFDDYSTRRTGLVDEIASSHGGNTGFAGLKGAYLFDLPNVQVGPLGSLVYTGVGVDRYTEKGDPLLNQAVGRQRLDDLTGGLGVQARSALPVAGYVVTPFLDLTAQRDFLSGKRSVVTAQTYALGLPIRTAVEGYGDHTYGKVAAGASIDLGHGISAMLNGGVTFARATGDDRQVNGGIKVSF